jgi:WD40 repeat protein
MNRMFRVVGVGLMGGLLISGCGPASPKPPVAAPPQGPSLWAVVVGIDDYPDGGIADCPGAVDDARTLQDWVQAPGQGNSHVLLMDPNSRRQTVAPSQRIDDLYPTRENLDWAIRGWLASRVRPGDRVLIYFAGRAIVLVPPPGAGPGTPGRPVLLPIDAKAGRWESTGWAIEQAIDDLATRAENPILVWIDTSRSRGDAGVPPPGLDRSGLGWLSAIARGPGVTACLTADEAKSRPRLTLIEALGMAGGHDERARGLLAGLVRFTRGEEPPARGFRMVCGLSPEPTPWSWPPPPPGPAPPGPPTSQGHCDRVLNVAVTPDGGQMISGGADSSVQIRRVADRALLRVLLGHELGVTSLALSPSASCLATGDGSGRVRLWRGQPGRVHEFQQVALSSRQPPHAGAVVRLAFLPDGAHFASLDNQGNCLLWDVQGDSLRMIPLGLNTDLEVTDLACGPGRVAVAATGPGEESSRIHFFGVDGAPLGTALAGPGGIVNAGRLALAGDLLVATDDQGRAGIWDVGDFDAIKGVAPIQMPGGDIRALVSSPTGLVLGGGETISLWTPGRAGPDRSLTVGGLVQQVVSSDDGQWLAARTGDGGLRVWFLPQGEDRAVVLDSGASAATSLTFGPQGRFLMAGFKDGAIRTWDLLDRPPRGVQRHVIPSHQCGIATLGVSPDGRYLLQVDADRTAWIWDLQEGRGLSPSAGPWTSGVPLAADLDRLLMTDVAGDVVLIERASGRRLTAPRFPRPPAPGGGESHWRFDRVAASPDGGWFAAGCSQGSLACLWDKQGNLVLPIRAHRDDITAVAFSSDSRWLLTASFDGTAMVWDMRGAKDLDRPRWTLPAGDPQDLDVLPVTAATIIAAGKTPRVITGHVDGRIIGWAIGPGGRPVKADLGSLAGRVHALAAAPDGRWLAAVGDDPTLLFWPKGAGGPTLRLPLPHTERLTALVAWPDGKLFATGADQTTVRLWGPVGP